MRWSEFHSNVKGYAELNGFMEQEFSEELVVDAFKNIVTLNQINAITPIIETLVKLKAQQGFLQSEGYGALLRYAIRQNARLDFIQQLLSFAPIQQDVAAKENAALDAAILNRNVDVFDYLLTFQAVKTELSKDKTNALDVALETGDYRFITRLGSISEENTVTKARQAIRREGIFIANSNTLLDAELSDEMSKLMPPPKSRRLN